MRRVLIYPVLCLSLAGAAVACSRDDNRSTVADNSARSEPARSDADDDEQVEVTGCLTANQHTNQFVLTANANALTSMTGRAAGNEETFHYVLVGGNNLPSYVGREVVVKGTLEGDDKEIDLESKERSEQPATESRGDKLTPAVETEQEVDLKVEQLHVGSIAPTGSPCQIGQRK